MERLRNVKTGEFRDVETNSDEYYDLINEVYDHEGSARPKWEISGAHHARRLDEGDVQEEDHGYEHKPIPGAIVGIDEVHPELHPERALTQGEVDSGIESWEQKMEGTEVKRAAAPNAALTNAEPLERSDPQEREERGQELAGSEGGKKQRSRSSRRSSGSSGRSTGGSGSGSGSAADREAAGAGSSSGGSSS